MALESDEWPWSWMLTALVILATTCIAFRNQARGSSKGVLSKLAFLDDGVSFARGPRDFILDCLARYGDPFTISIMGRKQTVINSSEAIKFVLSTAHASFPGGYSTQFMRLFSEGKFSDARHPHFRKIVLSAVSGDGLQNLLPFISSLAEKTVKFWENQAVVNTVEEVEKFVFKVGMHIVWRDVKAGSEEMEQIRNEISILVGGLVAVPINLPGFYYHKALKTRQVLVSRIQSAISKRREAGSEVNDVLNGLMSIREVEVTDYDICCIMLSMLFVASATTAGFLPWVLKYLHDFPEVRKRVQDEQDCIRQKMVEDKSLAWFKPKSSMPYTLQVIYEVLRIESIVSFIPRRANKDVDYNGLVFRKGSYVWASIASIQYNPEYYPNPREFDPSRFEEKPKPNTFMPFGHGPHLCPGSELAITETMLIIHHLITNYNWERCGHDQGVVSMPIRKPTGGFPIHLVKR